MHNDRSREISTYLRLAELCGYGEDEKKNKYMKKVESLLNNDESTTEMIGLLVERLEGLYGKQTMFDNDSFDYVSVYPVIVQYVQHCIIEYANKCSFAIVCMDNTNFVRYCIEDNDYHLPTDENGSWEKCEGIKYFDSILRYCLGAFSDPKQYVDEQLRVISLMKKLGW